MSRTYKDSPNGKGSRPGGGRKQGRSRRTDLSVRAVRRNPPDLRKLSRALIDLAIAQSEAEAAASQVVDDSPTNLPSSAGEPADE